MMSGCPWEAAAASGSVSTQTSLLSLCLHLNHNDVFFSEQSDLDSLGVYGAGVRVCAVGTVLSFYKGFVCVN